MEKGKALQEINIVFVVVVVIKNEKFHKNWALLSDINHIRIL